MERGDWFFSLLKFYLFSIHFKVLNEQFGLQFSLQNFKDEKFGKCTKCFIAWIMQKYMHYQGVCSYWPSPSDKYLYDQMLKKKQTVRCSLE